MKALIFPSLSETLALPILEARSLGLPILAAERDYVRDVVDPNETFDPESAHSIMRAVLRFLGKAEAPVTVASPEAFLSRLGRMRAEAGPR
jgi:glycosyltransferase involved in cell wall biosynthesis